VTQTLHSRLVCNSTTHSSRLQAVHCIVCLQATWWPCKHSKPAWQDARQHCCSVDTSMQHTSRCGTATLPCPALPQWRTSESCHAHMHWCGVLSHQHTSYRVMACGLCAAPNTTTVLPCSTCCQHTGANAMRAGPSTRHCASRFVHPISRSHCGLHNRFVPAQSAQATPFAYLQVSTFMLLLMHLLQQPLGRPQALRAKGHRHTGTTRSPLNQYATAIQQCSL
jgi:hypothetical protein